MFSQKLVSKIEIKYLTLKFQNLESVADFVFKNCEKFQEASDAERTGLYSVTRCILIPCLRSEWSFGIQSNGKLVGVSMQVDIIEYIKLLETVGEHPNFPDIVNAARFSEYLTKQARISERGQHLISILNLSDKKLSRKQISLLHQNLYVCKVGGWKNVLFATNNPIPFLKINADVVDDSDKNEAVKQYLVNLKMSTLSFSTSPFQKIYSKL